MTGPKSNANNNSNNNTAPAVPFKKLKISSPSPTTTAAIAVTVTTMSATSTPTKKDNNVHDEKDEFEIVKVYLLNCPLVGSNSPAIKAAIEGIEREEKRRIRDAKLRSKFGGGKSSGSYDPASPSAAAASDDGDELVVIEKEDVDHSGHPVLVEAPETSKSIIHNNNSSSNSNSNSNSNSSQNNNDDMEWQDVPQQQKDGRGGSMEESFVMGDSDMTATTSPPDDDNDDDSSLGRTLASACIEAIAKQEPQKPVTASTPLAAIAIALHASLRSDVLGFACTGILEAPPKTALGFAPPIRELSKNCFLPPKFDNHGRPQQKWMWPSQLRYRKADTGAVFLRVEGHPSTDHNDGKTIMNVECKITFAPANSRDDPAQHPCLRFPVSEHINLESWNAAKAKTSRIPPSLHYKNLPGLLSKFCRTFDLGAVHNPDDSTDDNNNDKNQPKSSSSSINLGYSMGDFHRMTKEPNAQPLSRSAIDLRVTGYEVPSTVGKAFPPAAATAAARRMQMSEDPLRMGPRRMMPGDPHRVGPSNNDYYPHRGDFSGDLLPSPSMGQQPHPLHTGNLMGPNHPMFARGGGGVGPLGGLPLGGPGTMQPRFDPVMPPGIGGGGDEGHPDGRHSRQQRMQGTPNPDHLRPPNSFGNHSMFM